MKIWFKITVFSLFFIAISCKNKEQATLTKYNGLPPELEFKDKFHEANNQKIIGQYDKAILLFNECLVINPNSAACFFGLSEIYLDKKDANKAIEYAQKAVDINPNNKWYVTHIANLFHSIGNYHQSAKFYAKLFNQFNEKNIDNRYKLVEAYIYSNQNKKAIDQMNIIELETGKTPQLSLTKHDMYNALGKTNEANNEIESLLAEYPNNEEIKNTILDYYLQTSQNQKAENIANDILKINPDNGNAILGLADIEIRKNNLDKSFDYLEKGFTKKEVTAQRKIALLNGLTTFAFDPKDPSKDLIQKRLTVLYKITENTEYNNPDFLSLYGTFLNMSNKKGLARQKFKKACILNPSDYNAWDGLLNADYNAKLFDSLFVDGKASVEVFASQPMMYLLTGIGAYESKHFEAAEEYLLLGQDFVINDPEMASEFEYHKAKAYWLSGNKQKADDFFKKALNTYPKSAKVYYGYSLLLFNDNELELALEKALKAIEYAPKNAIYYDHLASIYFKQQKYSEAKKYFEKAILLDYGNPIFLEHYGDALALNNEIIDAVEIWKESKNKGNKSAILFKKIKDKKYYNE